MRVIALCLGAVGVAAPSLAQQPTTPPYEETVVVTASLVSAELEDSPASVDLLDEAEIRARQATSVAELLATLPGAAVVASGPAGQSTSLFVRGAESDQTLVLWNGVELNNPFFGGFNWAFLPADGVERVELVRGPASAVHGSDAIGGVVQVISSRSDRARLRLEAGAEAYRRASLVAGGDVGRIHVDLFAHLRRGDSELANGFFDGGELAGRLEWAPRADTTIGLLARANESDTGIPLSGGRPALERRIGWRESQLAVPLAVERRRWSFEAQLSTVRLESAFRDPEDPFGFTAADTESDARRLRAVATYRPVGELSVAFGGELERLEVSDRSVFGPNLTDARQRTRATFLELGRSWPAVRLEAGLRHDDNNVFGGELSPRAGVVWAPTGSTRLRLTYGEGFRAPSLGELFFPFSGNPTLEPEVSRSLEVGVERRLGPWRLALAAFESRQSNLIDFDFVRFTNVNVGAARSRGGELGLGYDGRRFSGRADVGYLDAEDRATGLDLLRRARWSGSAALTARTSAWTWNFVGRYVGERSDVDPATFVRTANPAFLAFDLAVQWQGAGRWSPYARVENLADRRYAEALGFPAAGRTAIVGLALDLD